MDRDRMFEQLETSVFLADIVHWLHFVTMQRHMLMTFVQYYNVSRSKLHRDATCETESTVLWRRCHSFTYRDGALFLSKWFPPWVWQAAVSIKDSGVAVSRRNSELWNTSWVFRLLCWLEHDRQSEMEPKTSSVIIYYSRAVVSSADKTLFKGCFCPIRIEVTTHVTSGSCSALVRQFEKFKFKRDLNILTNFNAWAEWCGLDFI